MLNADPRELNKAPFQEEVEALRVTLAREERLLKVLAAEIATVRIDHERATHQKAQAQAALDAASLIYNTSEKMLSGLETQHDQLLKNVAEKRAALHPIRRVPAELWADIFTRWVDQEEFERVQRLDSQPPTEFTIPASLVASSVSHFWRKTALSTPTLVCNSTKFISNTSHPHAVAIYYNSQPLNTRNQGTCSRMGQPVLSSSSFIDFMECWKRNLV